MPPYYEPLPASARPAHLLSSPPSWITNSQARSTTPANNGVNASSILKELPSEVLIPTFLILVLSSITVTAMNGVFNMFAHRDRMVMETFQQWRRVLWMSKAAHIVEAPSADQAPHMTQAHHPGAVTVTSTPAMSPVELYNSAAFFRGIAGPTALAASPTGTTTSSATDVVIVDRGGVGAVTLSFHAALGAPYTGDAAALTEMEMYHEENPPAAVPAPVVVEALTNTMEAVRRESQRIIFEFHPYYIILCATKAFAMLIYIQYHFGRIDGGWRRFCICGAANIFSGLLTPVWEYTMMVLLPRDLDRTTPVVVKEEKKTDSVFIVELLLRISSLELNDLPTVLVQGTSFVAFAAVLVPLLCVFCLSGLVRYLWIYVPLWLVYFVVRQIYYQGAGTLPSARARNSAAVMGMTSEMLKAFLMKMLTVLVLLFTMQSSLLLGLAWAEGATYDEGLEYMTTQEFGFHTGAFASSFRKVCLVSQLFL
ncbi:conserved hypothetical protein [Leishmania braziliensis MHOM/BR/75/M2904]|uniref:Transmembrane protein n=2 Tax=Leishmania braziliensis TaxID=5660 RepID=A4HFI8_LEIBR|nr:conserved hypothetical protein [Leishmania braziliensis MHOM/BR/75/M2904]KAI5684618.1 hypothetical protein MNV84_04918 [Leishmania braziliensis]CAJ2475138.1 unnamed protein product [Leishmania braziliensis]CAJ2475640.1 unnamed protein product [Leishmania braziliensis]CAM45350.1 conserved hypothetical protein [Leishmania braziliensis MHOM/BR/75/M2904]SYZ66994.1 hypothetical_protein [Leishmania braziliensis MHOM/BR/75/M2904]